ncbi:hypothetical protein [Nostoc sp. WHI]|uniref:hypothetical protein n=1 Tax=Nostoc sp. WHI TaxID=2650611 RepID=UPI0018C6A35C|nr:hypothetical protein [Nostoc sp. WHI]MBG1270510.1 hypothetical protein [Nostoc sp. WHI]
MPRNLEIFNREEWFLSEGMRDDGNVGYPIYYRHALSYSIAKNIIDGKNKAWMKQEVDRLITSFNNEKSYQCDDKFVELYPLAIPPFERGKGFILVDQTDSYYPLVFYSDSSEREGKPRVSALKYSLESIKDGLEEIYDKLSELSHESEWDFDFQNDLWKIYPGKPYS